MSMNETPERAWVEVESSNIAAISFDKHAGECFVRFHSGGTYAYSDFAPGKFAAFEMAESKGKFFHREVKGQHPHRKLED